jgi:UrcA family protein
MLSKLTSLVIVFSLGAVTAAAAQTARPDEPRQAVVRYQDLDLATSAGANSLQTRLDGAARLVCGPEPSARELKRHKEFADCVVAARSAASQSMALAVAKARAGQTEAAELARK